MTTKNEWVRDAALRLLCESVRNGSPIWPINDYINRGAEIWIEVERRDATAQEGGELEENQNGLSCGRCESEKVGCFRCAVYGDETTLRELGQWEEFWIKGNTQDAGSDPVIDGDAVKISDAAKVISVRDWCCCGENDGT